MARVYIKVLIVLFTVFFCGCDKHYENERVLFGTWIKGARAGDTLVFMRKDNKNILRYNLSFNASLPAIRETEFSYRGGKLYIKQNPVMADFSTVSSFTWKQYGHQFNIQGIQLFPIMSSTVTNFIFGKI